MKLIFLDNFTFQRLIEPDSPVELDIKSADEVIELEKRCNKYGIEFLTYYSMDELRFVIVKQKLKLNKKKLDKVFTKILTKFDFDFDYFDSKTVQIFELIDI